MNKLYFLLSCCIVFIGCSNAPRINSKSEIKDTVQIIQTTLDSYELDSLVPFYRDSILKIFKNKFTLTSSDLKWKNRSIVYLDSTIQNIEIDTVGMLLSLSQNKNKYQKIKYAPPFKLIVRHLDVDTLSNKATCNLLLINQGIVVIFELQKQQENWIIIKKRWHLT